MHLDLTKTILLCPKNDEESVLILQIAKSAGIPTVVSPQEHGAKLELEKDLEERLKKANPQASTIVIVETPGPEREQELEKAGYEVIIIDHHRYEGLNRMKQESSLDQFLVLFELDDAKLEELGFDPFLVKGIGMMDRGWVWELAKEGIEKADRKRIMDYYQSLLEDMGGLKTGDVESARTAWDGREVRDGVIIVRSTSNDPAVHIRQALSSILAENFDEPPVTLVVEGNGRIAVQDTDKATKLHEKFGGYVFGKDLCWGFAPTVERPAPSVGSILKVLVSA
ncbi:MAG: hypothetical protein WC802_01705 [Patescibacteria group bacterium]|jgi:hypothetical protein